MHLLLVSNFAGDSVGGWRILVAGQLGRTSPMSITILDYNRPDARLYREERGQANREHRAYFLSAPYPRSACTASEPEERWYQERA